MKTIIKTFNELSTNELYELLKIRSEVFVVEQKCIYQDLDGIDYDSFHIYLKDDDNSIIAYLRIFKKNDNCTYQMGRVLTTKRRKGYGKTIVSNAINFLKAIDDAQTLYIEAQTYAIDFYKQHGFEIASEEFLEDGIPHIKMILKLKGE